MMELQLIENQARANEFLQRSGLQVKQENGQRIIHPIKNLPEDLDIPHGHEVFIGRIPREIFEDELLPLFAKAGAIYKFRLMMEFSGLNRGFAFAQYYHRQSALNAINLFNKYQIRPNCHIGVVESLDNNKLLIDHLPTNVTASQISQKLSDLTTGVRRVTIIHVERRPKDKMSAIVEFDSHKSATMARRLLLPADFVLFDRKIKVDWARPEAARENYQPIGTMLVIGNLGHHISNPYFEMIFSLNGFFPIIKSERRSPSEIIITYKERSHAISMYDAIKENKPIFSSIASSPKERVVAGLITPEAYNNIQFIKLINKESRL